MGLLYLLADTETAGLGAEKRACEIALRLIDEDMNTLQEWDSLVDPEIPINPAASLVNGITDDMVRTAPTITEFMPHVLGKPFDGDICLIGHNVTFDLPLIVEANVGNITHTVCTLELARAYITGPANYKLQTLREFFAIPENNAHRALGDVDVCHQLLKKIVELSGRSLLQHAETEERVIHVMSFGKHAGKPLYDLPLPYMQWLLALPDLDSNLRKSLEIARLLK